MEKLKLKLYADPFNLHDKQIHSLDIKQGTTIEY